MEARSQGFGLSASWLPPDMMSQPSSANTPTSIPRRSDASVWSSLRSLPTDLRLLLRRSVFLALIAEEGWDLLCHHGADVTNYKSPDFDTVAALEITPITCRLCLKLSGKPAVAGCF